MKNLEIEQKIIIVDDNSQDGSYEKILEKYGSKYMILQTGRETLYQNAGLPLDLAAPHITTDYVCSLDCDCIPMSKDWLITPISKVDEGYVFVGRNSAFEQPYMEFGKNNPNMVRFMIVDNCYRVSTTKDFKYISENCGFSVHFSHGVGNNWNEPGFTPMTGHADSGVAANYYVYAFMGRESFPMPIIKVIGRVDKHGGFGQNIDDLVFHMALGSRRVSPTRGNISDVGDEYEGYIKRMETDGFTDDFVMELFSKCSHTMYKYIREE